MHRTLILLVCAVATVVLLENAAEAQVTETYVFRDSLLPTEGAGNALEPVFNGTGSILTGGAGFVGGTYVTQNISVSACASSPSVRAWAFPVSGGLRHANVAPAVVTGSYSISMLLRYHPMDAGYARLIDFSNSTSDNGIYKLAAGVSFYPVGTYAAGSFVDDQDVFVTITRDATSQLVSLFINGVASGTYMDTTNLYAPAASALYFLMDNTTGSAAITETDAGVISYLQVRDTPMTPAQVAASLAAICDTVACGDGNVDAGEECDDAGVVASDGCSSTCTVEAGWVCTGDPSVCAPLCGNSALDPGEACDDGARADGDGCSATCTIETGYFCAGTPSVCTSCTVCAPGMVEVSACSATADTVCAAGDAGVGTTDAGPADGGPPDAGAALVDAGLPDAGPGRADAGPPDAGPGRGDASSGADASTPPPSSSDGGCGCSSAGSTRRAGAAGLGSMLALGLVGARRARRRAARSARR